MSRQTTVSLVHAGNDTVVSCLQETGIDYYVFLAWLAWVSNFGCGGARLINLRRISNRQNRPLHLLHLRVPRWRQG